MRLLADWIDEFVDLTSHLPSPQLFRKWVAISAIAGVLERKVWVKTMNMELHPNLYVVLVGPPGVGKTVATSLVEDLWRSITGLHVAPKSVSKASLIDSLAEAKRTKTIIDGSNSKHMEYNSLLVNAGELGVLIPQYDPEFMNILTDIWDGRVYEERRRSKDLHIIIKKPQLNILAATTPSYLNQTLPEGAWDQGFLSRTFLIFSGETTIVDIFSDQETDFDKFAKIKSDLRNISDIVGLFKFEPEAREAIRNWHLTGRKPEPDHPKLVHYNIRRTQQLLKLCMVAAASRGSDLIIRLADYQRALGWILEAEVAMGEIFKALGARGDGQVIEEAYHYLYKIFMATTEPVAENRLVGFVSEKVPAYNVLRIIDVMEKSGRIEKGINSKTGVLGWKPKTRVV
jgi:hypothetical protein